MTRAEHLACSNIRDRTWERSTALASARAIYAVINFHIFSNSEDPSLVQTDGDGEFDSSANYIWGRRLQIKGSDWNVNSFPFYCLSIFILKCEFKFLNKGKNHDINKKEEIKNFSQQHPFWLYVDWVNSCGGLRCNTTACFCLARCC